jgi:hypothetical protein
MPKRVIVSWHNIAGKCRDPYVASNIPNSNGQPGALKFAKDLLTNRGIHAIKSSRSFCFSSLRNFHKGRCVALHNLADRVTNGFDEFVARGQAIRTGEKASVASG